MKVGMQMLFQNFQGERTDEEVYRNELRLAELAEPLGFDAVWGVEHHFFDYSMCPDNMQFLSYMAGKTSTIKLGTAAVILPWNDPLRVAEKMALLDHVSNGRALYGMGRGLARGEYQIFDIDMGTTRERFDESARMTCEALETGVIEGDGPFYKQPRTEIRPRPFKSFKDRLYAVAMSPDSVPICAELGASMMMFAQKPWEDNMEHIDMYRSLYRKYHSDEPKPVVAVDFMCCDESADKAEEMAHKYMAAYYLTVIQHYEMLSDHFKDTRGYSAYGDAAAMLRDVGLEGAGKAFVNINSWGTPQMILEKMDARRQIVGDFELNIMCSYAGMPYDMAESSMRLFSSKVMPELQSWGKQAKAAE